MGSSTRRVPARSPSPRSRTCSAPSAISSRRTRPPSSASSSALSLMRRTTSATWSSLTSSSPLPPKSLSTRLHNIAEFQEFPGNRKKKKTNGTAKAPHAEKEKKRPQLHLGPQMRTSKPGHIANAKHRNEIFRFRSIRSAIEVQSSSPLKALISLLFLFFYFSFVVFFWLEMSLCKLLVILLINKK